MDLSFSIAKLPRVEFGAGTFSKLPEIIHAYGNRVLIVTGKQAFTATPLWVNFQAELIARNIHWGHFRVSSEPSPTLVDDAVKEYAKDDFDVVVAIGGGSPLDAGKAIAGLLKVKNSVMDYLEGVGPELSYEGPAVPFIAVPTTAGTGSEATKNAVLSVQDKQQGFKKSFRHDKLVAEYAIIDPELFSTCPKALIAANGMDALTQLIESYVSTKANPFTDALALDGIEKIRQSLLPWYDDSPEPNLDAQANMAYAAWLSGITLAQVGLGSVHGLASPMGAFYPIPHGVVCGTLLADATEVNIEAMEAREPDNPALKKYARLGKLLRANAHCKDDEARAALVAILKQWCRHLQLETLDKYGVSKDELDHIVVHSRGSSMKTNPIVLTDEEIKNILLRRLEN
ncbi:MAG: iron-containing alcohol dehydrogenase [Gammaproteobacteria bacterium]|nr:iron-containing alcohol dehydrogenase [Gammaproteobacteria bacterium]